MDNPSTAATAQPKIAAMRMAVSKKNPSGTMLMSISSFGFRIQRSLSKKIWWKVTKASEKSVARMTESPANSKSYMCYVLSF